MTASGPKASSTQSRPRPQPGPWDSVKVTLYNGCFDKQGEDISLGQCRRIVRVGEHELYARNLRKTVTVQEYTEYIRARRQEWIEAGYDAKQVKKRFDEFKGVLPAVTWSGLFQMARGADLITAHSGMIAADVDGLTVKEIEDKWDSLIGDPHFWLVFLSPSETGIKIIVPVSGLMEQWPIGANMTRPEKTAVANQFQYAAYFTICRYILETHGLSIDGSCKDSSRLCYLAYDDKAHSNRWAKPLEVAWSPDVGRQIDEERAHERERAAQKRDQGKTKPKTAPSSKAGSAQAETKTASGQAETKAEDHGPFHRLPDHEQCQLVDACLDALDPDDVPVGFGAAEDAGDRHRWDTSIGMAIHSWDSGDRGLEKYLTWGQRSAHKSDEERNKAWDHFSDDGKITVGTLLKFAREAGAKMPWVGRSHNHRGQDDSISGRSDGIDESCLVVLPSGDVTISQCAADVFKRIAPTHTMFYRGGSGGGVVVELSHDQDGNAYLEPLKAKAFRTRVERHSTLMAWRAGRDYETVLKPSKMAVDDADAILASLEARELLPGVSSVLRCAVLTEKSDGELVVLHKGYHPQLGYPQIRPAMCILPLSVKHSATATAT